MKTIYLIIFQILVAKVRGLLSYLCPANSQCSSAYMPASPTPCNLLFTLVMNGRNYQCIPDI